MKDERVEPDQLQEGLGSLSTPAGCVTPASASFPSSSALPHPVLPLLFAVPTVQHCPVPAGGAWPTWQPQLGWSRVLMESLCPARSSGRCSQEARSCPLTGLSKLSSSEDRALSALNPLPWCLCLPLPPGIPKSPSKALPAPRC